MSELEDKYERFYRNTGIDLAAEIAAGDAGTGLDNYYTKPEVDTALAGKSDTGHNHDTRYYTEAETNSLLSAKANTSAVTAVSNDLATHEADTANPHAVTKAQIGLSNVDNTSDLNKPISTSTQTALNGLDSRITNLENPSLFVVAGAIKPNGANPAQWAVLNDGVHVPLGGLVVTSTTTTAINISWNSATLLHTFIVTPDETLAALGWIAGASVGLSNAVIKIGDASGTQVNPQLVSNTSANLWIYGLFTA